MSKKKKKKNKEYQSDYQSRLFNDISPDKSKKKLNNNLDSALKEIKEYRLTIKEIDKLHNKKQRKKINKEQRDFYTQMEGIRARKKLWKKWEREGFLTRMTKILGDIVPMVQGVAKALMALIITFLSLDAVKKFISPEVINKLLNIYDLAAAI